MLDLQTLLEVSSSRHKHLCPRQVFVARIGLAGAAALGLVVPRSDKRLLVMVETDGCFADGVEAATDCTMGYRTLRLVDYGKIGDTFVDVKLETAVHEAVPLDDETPVFIKSNLVAFGATIWGIADKLNLNVNQ